MASNLALRAIESVAVSSNRAQDLVGGLGPDEGPGILVPGCQPGLDRGLELRDRAMCGASQPLVRQLGEPTLHEVQPGGVSRDEVEIEARMTDLPALDLFR